jgi:DNA-directed RNA polymerase specialized sigma24 family protein
MKHRQGKTCDQIATELGRPTGTVKSLLSRAYKTLRARLSPSGEKNP